jgi:hypothetical protein
MTKIVDIINTIAILQIGRGNNYMALLIIIVLVVLLITAVDFPSSGTRPDIH